MSACVFVKVKLGLEAKLRIMWSGMLQNCEIGFKQMGNNLQTFTMTYKYLHFFTKGRNDLIWDKME